MTGFPSIAIIDYTVVPFSVPESVIVTIPATNVIVIPTSSYVSVPSVVTIPVSWYSPVVVPFTWVSNVPATELVFISTQPSAVVISYENVPTFVPSVVIATVPASNVVVYGPWNSIPTVSFTPVSIASHCNFLADE